jgi:hypothetical protein
VKDVVLHFPNDRAPLIVRAGEHKQAMGMGIDNRHILALGIAVNSL